MSIDLLPVESKNEPWFLSRWLDGVGMATDIPSPQASFRRGPRRVFFFFLRDKGQRFRQSGRRHKVREDKIVSELLKSVEARSIFSLIFI